MKKKKYKSKAVSAVIGVILMVAITVAIAGTVYVYVSQHVGQNEVGNETEEPQYEGNITEKFRLGYNNRIHYFFVLEYAYDIEVNEGIYYFYDIGDYYST